jgi:hypothetical protein
MSGSAAFGLAVLTLTFILAMPALARLPPGLARASLPFVVATHVPAFELASDDPYKSWLGADSRGPLNERMTPEKH